MALPLAVDLDGTLIHGDLFTQAMTRLVTRTPWQTPQLAWWLAQGRAHAKAALAARLPCDVAALRYNEPLLAWLREERASGRMLVLATAYDQRDAVRVSAHLGLFKRVIASDGVVNRKSARKAEALRAAFPEGFVYAGNERADLKVWEAAAAAVIVNASAALEAEARRRFEIERVFPRR